MWESIHSFLSAIPGWLRRERGAGARPQGRQSRNWEPSPRIPIVALVVSDQDRKVLADISAEHLLDVHFAKSCDETWNVTHRLNAPVVVVDRDWPQAEWRAVVHSLASLPQRACVILISAVADEYLWQELVRCGGYDTLAKPLRAGEAARALKLALSYWSLASSAVAPGPNSAK